MSKMLGKVNVRPEIVGHSAVFYEVGGLVGFGGKGAGHAKKMAFEGGASQNISKKGGHGRCDIA